MLMRIFEYLFYYLYQQLEVINSIKYVKMEIHDSNRDLYYTFKVGEHGLFLYVIHKVIICNFIKNVT